MSDNGIKFDPNQEYQHQAIAAVVGVFDGQSLARSQFEMPSENEGTMFTDHGIGNSLVLDASTLADNVRSVQAENHLPEALRLPREAELESLDFSVEMETGTGKTYVYLRTILELHRVYGFAKFVIVVPSVPIREGTLSNLRLQRDHLRDLYDGVPYTSMVYNSARLADLRSFAQSTNLSILVVNLDAFNKDTNRIYQAQDQTMGVAPIDFVRSTNPVVVLDEPQNMESPISQKAIASLNPIATLRYSATHRTRHNLVHRLTPADALSQNLVKQIEVWSVVQDDDLNRPNIEVVSVTASKRGVSARIKIDTSEGSGPKPKTFTVKGTGNEDLYEMSGRRTQYEGYLVEEINAETESVEFANGIVVEKGTRFGPDRDAIQKTQIRTAVREHFDKEIDIARRVTSGDLPAPIKVLSLFFIDRVANYDPPDAKFRRWFYEAYDDLAAQTKYKTLDLPTAEEAQGSYFSKTRGGDAKDTSGSTIDDGRTYELIMRRKDDLMFGDEPLRFIFSHSALREGWDNPNVFVITTLNDTRSEVKKRQEIGRGLRLPFMQTGHQCKDPMVNRLTIVANESYEEFAASLQKEIEDESGTEFARASVKDRRKRKTVRLRDGVLDDPDFKALWDAIKHRTRYRVSYDADKVVDRATSTLANLGDLQPPKIRTTKSRQTLSNTTGVTATVITERAPTDLAGSYPIPDLLGHLARSLPVSRALIRRVLVGSGTLGEASTNPQKYMDEAHTAIENALMEELASGITYEKIAGSGADAVYEMQLLEETELTSYLTNLVAADNSAYEDVIIDSDIERAFAEALSKREDVKVFVKLPWWFKVATPLGTYNPDWAIVKTDEDGLDRAYLVRETKGTNDLTELRPAERLKILFGNRHFESIGVDFGWLKSAADL
ncbi:MAG: restriction endonuclease subunit [Ilumatobacteraceae bacterium]|nr:restriction endonuclease subunit [Ilumatobacteraceae bacterium]